MERCSLQAEAMKKASGLSCCMTRPPRWRHFKRSEGWIRQRLYNAHFLSWGDAVWSEWAEVNNSTAVRLCCSSLQHLCIWLIIYGQLLQKLKLCWNDNSIKGADGPTSKCFTKDWVDIIKLDSQWLRDDSWYPRRWNFSVAVLWIQGGWKIPDHDLT